MRTRKPSAQYVAQLLGAMLNQMSLTVAGGTRRTLEEVLAGRVQTPEPQVEVQPDLQVKV